ncbi:MAG: hypothetical protein KAH72_05110 [Flavobacteriaceae bacterium]|nr:hypothetical protein [Flavobacteriaceae bacterium]
MSTFYKYLLLTCITVLTTTISSNGQSLNMPAEGYSNTFGTAVSGGVFLDKDAVFWGFAVDYSKVIKENWIINISFGYDKEFSKKKDQEESVVNTLTPSLAIGYALNRRIAMGLGLGKGIFDDDNEDKHFQFNKNGGWTIGLIGVYSFYQKGPHSFDISGGIERGLSSPETDLTLEFGYGYSF